MGFANVSSRMDSERGDRINTFLIVPHVFFFKTNTFIHFSLLKFYFFVYFIVYRNPIVLYLFLQKRYAHDIFTAGRAFMLTQEKKCFAI